MSKYFDAVIITAIICESINLTQMYFRTFNFNCCKKMKPTGFASCWPCAHSQDHWNWYKMVEINGVYKCERVWLKSLLTMSNYKVFAKQDRWTDNDSLVRWTNTTNYMGPPVTHMGKKNGSMGTAVTTKKCPALWKQCFFLYTYIISPSLCKNSSFNFDQLHIAY